ncbi:MAG: TolC family protein [Victivallales bacterium]|nr:TolC family protein [Victivallales bacterium]
MQSIGYKIFLIWVAGLVPVWGTELENLLRQALTENPQVKAQRALVEQSLAAHREVLEFWDPTLYAAGGYGSQLRGLPLAPVGYTQVGAEDSLEAQGGVLVPVKGGAYLAAGAVTRRWTNPPDYRDPLYQHLVGVTLQIPLWRDRGFALLGCRERAALAACRAAQERLAGKFQEVRHSVELAYIDACSAQNAYRITQGATHRFERLNQEARELADLKTIPEYQYTETVRDLQNGREDEEIARNAHETSLIALAAAVGVREPLTALQCTPEEFLASAAMADLPDFTMGVEEAMEFRGEPRALQDDREQAQAQYEQMLEEHRDQVTLNLGVNWMDDSRRGPFSEGYGSVSENWGFDAMLSWSRPLDYTGADARAAQFQARMDELDAQLEAQRVTIAAELRTAQLRLETARRRLELVNAGVEAAQQTVAAEQERFKMGEGDSHAVLEAQKNLTATLLRQNAATAELLRALSDYRFACGYPE